MTFKPVAKIVYTVDQTSVVARGLSYTHDEVNHIISGPVKDLLLDSSGISEILNLVTSLASTDFESAGIHNLLVDNTKPEDWRVGEAIAEFHVTENNNCIFPWPTSRDLKNPNASPAGADLVGFQKTDLEVNPHRFAFGEIKTSSEAKWPPQVMYGRSGLTKQLEDLRDSAHVKGSLIRYLGYRAIDKDWADKYKSAAKRYISDNADVAIFGVLVRDVEPKELDLLSRAVSLDQNCPAATTIELYALYLPETSIANLPDKVVAAGKSGDEK